MKKSLLILIGGLIAGGLAFAGVCFVLMKNQTASGMPPELAWLKTEYQLSDADFSKILKAHAEYLPDCKAMCRRIEAKNEALQKELNGASGVTPEIQALLDESANLRKECQAQMLEHFFKVSRMMPPEQGQRYLSWIQSKTIFAQGHPSMHH